MKSQAIRVQRMTEQLTSDDKRVIPRYFDFGHPPRIRSIFRRLLKIPRKKVPDVLADVRTRFDGRHRDLEGAFREHYERAARHIRKTQAISDEHKLLIGAYFTMEYSIEAAALFNPSIVPHPDQSKIQRGAMRFLMSLRATGEGHVSSIVFRRGIIDTAGRIIFDPPPRYAYSAQPLPDKRCDKAFFQRKLREWKADGEMVEQVLEQLDETFTLAQLRSALDKLKPAGSRAPLGFKRFRNTILWLGNANYELRFPPDCLPSETVIFPGTLHESRGMEDLRLTRFTDDDGAVTYYGTYTAFDGFRIHPMLLATADFHTFHFAPLSGRYARNKGMAMFPRRIDGQYAMVSRHDGECLFLLRSNDLHIWNVSEKLQTPAEDWELIQLGNCGPPIETDAGWLLVTHGVGPMRRYCIGVTLLDKANPAKIIGRLREPLLVPTADESVGYVPNVVYSCGSVIHGGKLIVPYAMSDSRTGFATVSVRSLVNRLLEAGK